MTTTPFCLEAMEWIVMTCNSDVFAVKIAFPEDDI